MAITLGQWIILGLILVFVIFVAFVVGTGNCSVGVGIVTFIVGLLIDVIIMLGINWFNTNTASGIRNYKDWQSEIDNGIEREITITAEDGRTIFYYEGKVDIESNHEDNYIKFESEDGKRYIIYYGITDTILIIEK